MKELKIKKNNLNETLVQINIQVLNTEVLVTQQKKKEGGGKR